MPAPVHPGPALHAALDYCARRLLTALDAIGNGKTIDIPAGASLAAQLTPASDRLLRWWFSSDSCRVRVDNFHFAQRESILHTILAHELLRSDDPALLYRRACGAPPGAETPLPAMAADAHYRLRLAPGGGVRWVVQALLVWWWANATARADDDDGSAAGAGMQLIAATPGIRHRLQCALFGHASNDFSTDVDHSSLLRHARLFLPPALRTPFRAWLQAQAQAQHRDTPRQGASLQIVEAAAGAAGGPALALLTTSGARLRVELLLAGDSIAAIVDAPLERMIRRGAAKLPMLEAASLPRLPRLPPLRPLSLRMKPAPRNGLRPRLRRSHPALLRAGIDALVRREPGFATLDPARRPRLLVLCDATSTLSAARRFLIDSGFAPDTIAIGGDHACGDDVRAIVDTLPARSTLADARVCAVVVLRTQRGGVDPLAVVAAGAAPLWPEPDFAEVRSENRERTLHGRAPQNLIDVLSVIEHPQCRAAYAPLLRAGLIAHDERTDANSAATDGPAIDDLIVVAPQAHAAAFDLAMPLACDDGPQDPQRLCDLPRRVLRKRHALAVRKSEYPHDGCDIHDNGLRRAFLECAESDPEVESHCLIDPRRHGTAGRETWLAQGFAMRVWPEAVVRTASRVYLVNFQPFCPTRPQAPDATERRFAHWLRRANALPAPQRAHRVWCRAMLAAPLFWSWKRSEGTLSALLSTLADAAAPAPCGDFIL